MNHKKISSIVFLLQGPKFLVVEYLDCFYMWRLIVVTRLHLVNDLHNNDVFLRILRAEGHLWYNQEGEIRVYVDDSSANSKS